MNIKDHNRFRFMGIFGNSAITSLDHFYIESYQINANVAALFVVSNSKCNALCKLIFLTNITILDYNCKHLPHKANITVNKDAAGNLTDTLNSNI